MLCSSITINNNKGLPCLKKQVIDNWWPNRNTEQFFVTNKFIHVHVACTKPPITCNGMSTASRLQALHKRLGITLSDLSTEARNALEDMVDLAIALDLKDCSFTRLEDRSC